MNVLVFKGHPSSLVEFDFVFWPKRVDTDGRKDRDEIDHPRRLRESSKLFVSHNTLLNANSELFQAHMF